MQPGEPDYAEDVLETFSRFRQGTGKSYLKDIRDAGSMDHVEAAVAAFVARLNPDAFAALRAFTENHQPLIPEAVIRLERQACFYLAYLEVVDELADRGLPSTLPELGSDGQVGPGDHEPAGSPRRRTKVRSSCAASAVRAATAPSGSSPGRRSRPATPATSTGRCSPRRGDALARSVHGRPITAARPAPYERTALPGVHGRATV